MYINHSKWLIYETVGGNSIDNIGMDLNKDYTSQTIKLNPDYEGEVTSVLISSNFNLGNRKSVLYIHGYIDYFFHPHLGEKFNVLFFGILSVCGTYFLYTLSLDLTVLLPAMSIGLLSVGVLNLNNMRDRESDLKAGKNTVVVKIGAEFAKYYHYYLLGASFLFALLFTAIQFRSAYQFLSVFLLVS